MFLRKNKLCERIVFLDGMWGTGKAILAPVLGSFEQVEKQILNYNFEYLCTIFFNDKEKEGDAEILLQLMADVQLYDSMLSRNANFRPDDISGVFNNPYALRYFKRLFKSDDERIIEEILSRKPILQLMTHNILPISDLLFKTFGNGMKLIAMVRHPIYMAEHWYNYIERIGTDEKEFTLAIGGEGQIPWFAESISNYLSLKTMDKVIHCIDALQKMQEKIVKTNNNKIIDNIILVPFEPFVLDPSPWVEKIATLLGTKTTNTTKKALKNQMCPRKQIHIGKGKAGYGWNKDNLKLSEKDDFKRRLQFIKKESSSDAFTIMETLSNQYEKKYDFPREMPWEVISSV